MDTVLFLHWMSEIQEVKHKKTSMGDHDRAKLSVFVLFVSQAFSEPNNDLWISQSSPESTSGRRYWKWSPCLCLHSEMITVFGRKVFAFCLFLFSPLPRN